MFNLHPSLAKTFVLSGFLGFVLVFSSCGNRADKAVVKFAGSDPFKNNIVPSQLFSINCDTTNVIEGSAGITILCPKNCFLDANGNPFTGVAEIELAEAVDLDAIILSNLETTSNGAPLQSGGMLYFNVTANGEQLSIDKNNPIRIEIPTEEKIPDMMVYKGVRNNDGTMNWIEPKKIDNYLTTVDFSILDFLPANFYATVVKNLPYKNHTTATTELADSLYYNLNSLYGSEIYKGFHPTDYNEAYLNSQASVNEGEYQKTSWWLMPVGDTLDHTYIGCPKGINPAIIKVIKSKPYANTFIATKAFEKRLQAIFKTCDSNVIDLYIKNLDKNLYEVDSMVAAYLGGDSIFLSFYNERLTNVKNGEINASLLNEYYASQLKKVETEIKKQADKMLKIAEKENEAFKNAVAEYEKLLFKRESYRMEKYGFEWSDIGWVNVDKPLQGNITVTASPISLTMSVDNGAAFDRVYTYIVLPNITSINRLNTKDKVHFQIGNSELSALLIPNHGFQIISVGYKGEQLFTAQTTVRLSPTITIHVNLEPTTKDEFKNILASQKKYKNENSILTDLTYMKKMYEEEMRQKAIKTELRFLQELMHVTNPCCGYDTIPAK